MFSVPPPPLNFFKTWRGTKGLKEKKYHSVKNITFLNFLYSYCFPHPLPPPFIVNMRLETFFKDWNDLKVKYDLKMESCSAKENKIDCEMMNNRKLNHTKVDITLSF